jgi:hypothetical protein
MVYAQVFPPSDSFHSVAEPQSTSHDNTVKVHILEWGIIYTFILHQLPTHARLTYSSTQTLHPIYPATGVKCPSLSYLALKNV